MPGFCMGRSASRVRVRALVHARSYTQQYKRSPRSIHSQHNSELSSEMSELSFRSYLQKPETECANKVMVVVDSSPEARGALEWTLTHTVQSQDTVVLLYVVKQEASFIGEINQREHEVLRSMKNMCQLRRPEIHIEMAIREGKEKGPVIVDEANQRRVSLLVLGQRRRSILWRVRMIWNGKRTRSRIVDYCIQNANCMTIAVRRKNKKYGGYLITTKRHKNFWLLA